MNTLFIYIRALIHYRQWISFPNRFYGDFLQNLFNSLTKIMLLTLHSVWLNELEIFSCLKKQSLLHHLQEFWHQPSMNLMKQATDLDMVTDRAS